MFLTVKSTGMTFYRHAGRACLLFFALLMVLDAALSHGWAKGHGLSAEKTQKVREGVEQRAPAGKVHERRGGIDSLTATAAVVMDADTGELLFARKPQWRGQPASTIKVLAAMVALEEVTGDEFLRVSRNAASRPRSKIYLRPGKKYRAWDLLNATLLHSANDAAVALAEGVAGTEGAFARRMTELARRLGACDTFCRNATGLTAKGQYTTPYDLAIILRAAMEDPRLSSILQCRRTMACHTTVRNHNKALWQIPGARGGKTGYTSAARRTYVGCFERDGKRVIIAFLGSEDLWSDLRLLASRAFPSGGKGKVLAGRAAGHQQGTGKGLPADDS